MARFYSQGDVFYPFFTESTTGVSTVDLLIIRDDGFYYDFDDSTFKDSGWTTKEQTLTEKTEGVWVWTTGWTTPSADRTYKAIYKDDGGYIYEGSKIQVGDDVDGGDFFPFFVEPTTSISSVDMHIIRDDGFYYDFDDSTFKDSGWTTKEQALTEKTEGVWILSTGFTSPDTDRTYAVIYKDDSSYTYKESDDMQIGSVFGAGQAVLLNGL